MAKPSRTYHDPLHGAITLNTRDPEEALLIRLIDTSAFQRLRRIRQLGPAYLTFHGAESSRFTHSLGVMALARRAFDSLLGRYPHLRPHRATVLCAALLHDLGHGPFSHTAEEIFGLHHEYWTQRIIQDIPAIRDPLRQYSADLIPAITQVYTHTHPVPLVWQLVSSQLDCDRLDYLLRDSYSTGASYGRLDLDRILMALELEPDSNRLVVAHKGLSAIEHYLVVRHFMYAQVYNHPKNIAATWLLKCAFHRARTLHHGGQLEADTTVSAWLQSAQTPLSLDTYLAADDAVLNYHLQRWQRGKDVLLADLCRRYVDRDLLKTLEITRLSTDQQQSLLAQVQAYLEENGVPGHLYATLEQTWSQGYATYQQGIHMHVDNAFVDIKALSPLVKTLSQPAERIWLLYPREIQPWVQDRYASYGPQSSSSMP